LPQLHCLNLLMINHQLPVPGTVGITGTGKLLAISLLP